MWKKSISQSLGQLLFNKLNIITLYLDLRDFPAIYSIYIGSPGGGEVLEHLLLVILKKLNCIQCSYYMFIFCLSVSVPKKTLLINWGWTFLQQKQFI